MPKFVVPVAVLFLNVPSLTKLLEPPNGFDAPGSICQSQVAVLCTTPPDPTRRNPAPPHVVLPFTLSVRLLETSLEFPPLAVRAPFALTVPAPVSVPPYQLKGPLSVSVPAPVMVPPLIARTPFAPKLLAAARVSVVELIVNVWVPLAPPTVRLFTEALAFSVTV